MRQGTRRGRWWLVGGVAVLILGLGVGCWTQRSSLLAWWYLRGLAAATEGDREVWVGRVVGLGDDVVPGLLGRLTAADDAVGANVEVVLVRLADAWGGADDRWAKLSAQLGETFPRCEAAGQQCILKVHAAWLGPDQAVPAPPSVAGVAARLLTAASRSEDGKVRRLGLELVAVLLRHPGHVDWLGGCRQFVRASLGDAEPDTRLRAIPLAAQPTLGLLEAVVALLHDPMPEVRRQALETVGPLREAVTEDHLLPWLHDPDPDVRLLCEMVLRGRNFRGKDLHLGRLITDRQPNRRLQVLQHLRNDTDLEPGVWLRRLSIDPAPAVRAAAIRAAYEHPLVNLSDRIDQMARNDPNPTIQQLARTYRTWQQRKQTEP